MDIKMMRNSDFDGSLIFDKGHEFDKLLIMVNEKGLHNFTSGGITGVDTIW